MCMCSILSGRHNVAVTYEGLAVSSGASVCLAYNAAAITVSNIPTVAAGETVEFTGDILVADSKRFRRPFKG